MLRNPAAKLAKMCREKHDKNEVNSIVCNDQCRVNLRLVSKSHYQRDEQKDEKQWHGWSKRMAEHGPYKNRPKKEYGQKRKIGFVIT